MCYISLGRTLAMQSRKCGLHESFNDRREHLTIEWERHKGALREKEGKWRQERAEECDAAKNRKKKHRKDRAHITCEELGTFAMSFADLHALSSTAGVESYRKANAER